MSDVINFAAGIYLGMGMGVALMALVEVGSGAGWGLAWRIPTLILFWPWLFLANIYERG